MNKDILRIGTTIPYLTGGVTEPLCIRWGTITEYIEPYAYVLDNGDTVVELPDAPAHNYYYGA